MAQVDGWLCQPEHFRQSQLTGLRCLKSLVPEHQAQLVTRNYFQRVRPFPNEKAIRLPMDSPLILLSLTTLASWWVTKTSVGYQNCMKWQWHSFPLTHKGTELGFERCVISIITLFWLLRLTTWAMPKHIIIINWWAGVLKIWLYDMCSAVSPSALLLGNNYYLVP